MDPMQFLQLVNTGDPMVMQQLANMLAMRAPAPVMPGGETATMPGMVGGPPMTPPPIPAFGPPVVEQGFNMPPPVTGAPVEDRSFGVVTPPPAQPPKQGALTMAQAAEFMKMLNPQEPPRQMAAPPLPAQRQIQPMQQLGALPSFSPVTLAALLNGR